MPMEQSCCFDWYRVFSKMQEFDDRAGFEANCIVSEFKIADKLERRTIR